MNENLRTWAIGLKYFFKECTVYNLVFTLICVGNAFLYPGIPIMSFFWIKVIGYFFVGTSYFLFPQKSTFFFLNIGLDTKKLLWLSFFIDFILTFILVQILRWIL